MQKQNIFKTRTAALWLVLLLSALSVLCIVYAKAPTAASAADGTASSRKLLNIQFPSGNKRLGMCVRMYDRQDYIDMGGSPEDVTPSFNGTMYLYFVPKSGANIFSGHYVTITGATLTRNRDLYVGTQGIWYSYITAASGDYEISTALYDLLVNNTNYNVHITTNLTKVGQSYPDKSNNWVVNLCTDIDKDPNNSTYATSNVNYENGVIVTPTVKAVLPNEPSKTGYTFNGWYYDAGFTSPYNGEAVYQDTPLYAKLTPIPYAINYNLNFGNLTSPVTSYTIENAITLPTPTREGHSFKGWYTTANFSGNALTEIPKGSTGEKTLYAKWEINTYTVTFYVDGEIYTEIIVEWGSTLDQIFLVNMQSGEMVSLYLDSFMQSRFENETLIETDIQLFAESGFEIFISLKYIVNDEEIATDLLGYNTLMNNLRTPEVEGLVFAGWYYDKEFTRPVSAADKLTKNTVIYAKMVDPEVENPGFWKKVGAWFSSTGGIITVISIVSAIVLGGIGYAVYRKKNNKS